MSTIEQSAPVPRKPPVPRGAGIEAERVRQRLDGFDAMNSNALRILHQHFGETVTTNELRSIAVLLCHKSSDLKLERNMRRDSRVVVKWYDENMETISGLLQNVTLR
jgi:hypothetical protein